MEPDTKTEYSSDENDDSEDENSDLEITFGPWPPFPSKQSTDDHIQMAVDAEDLGQPSEHCEGEEQESISSEVSLDAYTDVESVEDCTKTDDIIDQCVQNNETEIVDVIGSPEMAISSEDCELNFENTSKETTLANAEFIEHDESRIPTDIDIVTNDSVHSGSSVYSAADEQTMIMDSLPTESDDVISNCVPSNSGVNLYIGDCINSDVIDNNEQASLPTESDDVISKTAPANGEIYTNCSVNSVIDTQTVVVKEEPVMDGYPDTSQSEMAKDDNLFVSTEHGKMFLRTVSTEPVGDNGKESDEMENDDLIDRIYLEGRGLIRKKSEKIQKKNKILEEEPDEHQYEQMPGRIIGHDASSGEDMTAIKEKRMNESPDQGMAHLYRQHPRTKSGKFKKLSSKLVHNSPKKRKVLEQGSGMLARKRKVVSPARSSSPVSGDDMVPEDEVSYNLRHRPADKEVGSATNDHGQVDLSLVKTEPYHNEQDLGSTVTDAGFNKTDSTSWIKKEPFTEDEENLTDNAMETNIPVPVKLIRNEVVNSGTLESGLEKGFEDLSQQLGDGATKLGKNPASLVVGGHTINLQGGKKIWYALPKGDKSAIKIGGSGDQKKIVKVIKLNNVKNGPNTIPLAGNLKLFRLQKAPNMSSCEGKEIPLSSLLNHKNVTLVKSTTDKAVNEQDKKDLMLKKIDGIIKENLELMKKNQLPTRRKGIISLVEQTPDQNQQILGPQWHEEIDEETGKTTMVLMPTQEKKDKKPLNTVIYRYDDRSKRSKKYRKVTDSSQKPNISSTPVIMLRPPVKGKQTRVVKMPAMCNSFTQTKEDSSAKKKLVTTGKALMVKDASIQTETSPENAETVSEEVSTETEGIGSRDSSTNLVGEVSDHSEETDLLMDVEDVDFINLENKSALDPLTVPRPVWKWNSRETVSIGVNTYKRSVGSEDLTTPLDHEYAIAPSKEKPKGQTTYVTERSKQYQNQWVKVNKMQKLIKRKTFLKNKEWEYECKVAMLKQKLEQRKGITDDTSEAMKKDTSMENTLSADISTDQIKCEGKEESNNPTDKVNKEKEGGKESKNSAVKLGTRSSSRIRFRQKQAFEKADVSKFFERVQMKLGEVEEVEVGCGQVTTYMTDSSDEEWKQLVSGLSPVSTVTDTQHNLSHRIQSVSKGKSHAQTQEENDVNVLCVPEEEGMELYLICERDADLREMNVFLMCQEDIDFDKYTTVIELKQPDNASCGEDIVLKRKYDLEDVHERIGNIFEETMNFDKDSYSDQAYSRHLKPSDVKSSSPHQFDLTSTESQHSLKVKTMTALSLRPVTISLHVATEMSTEHRTSLSLGSPQFKEMEKSLSFKSLKGKIDPFTTAMMAKKRLSTSRSLKVKEKSPSLRPVKVKERTQTSRSLKMKEISPNARTVKVTERSPTSRMTKVNERSPTPRQMKVKERSTNRSQEVKETRHNIIKETCHNIIQETVQIVSPILYSPPNLDSTYMVEECKEVNKTSPLGSGSKVEWTQKATDTGSVTEEMPGIEVDNNEFTQFDSPVDIKYEYITTDDYLYTEPLDLSIKMPPNFNKPIVGMDSERSIDAHNRQDVPPLSTCPNINIGKMMNFDMGEGLGADCVVQDKLPMPSINTTHFSTSSRMSTVYDTTRNTDSVEVNRYFPRSHLLSEMEDVTVANDKRVLSRPSPRKTFEFDENANFIGLELNNGESCLSKSNVLCQLDISKSCENLQRKSNSVVQHADRTRLWCHDGQQNTATRSEVPYTTSRFEVPHTASRSEVPYTTSRSEVPHTASRSEVPYTASRSEVPYTASRSEVPHTASRSEVPHTASRSEVPYTTSRFEVPHTASRSEVPCTASRSEVPHTASRSEVPHTASRSEVPYIATRSEDSCFPLQEGIGKHIQSGSQVHTRNTRQQERKQKLLNPNLGIRIQDTFRSDRDVDEINFNLNHHKMYKNMLDKEKRWLNSKLIGESKDVRKNHYPNTPYNSNRDTDQEVDERMLMHMMYTKQTGADGYSEEDRYFRQGESSGRRLHVQCSYPMDLLEVNWENVPLDLSCNKNTVPRESVPYQPISVGNFRPSFESSVRGLQPTFETFPDPRLEFASPRCNSGSHFGIVNEMPNVRKLDSSYLMLPEVLTNLRLPDNIPELLGQPAIPNPGCIAYLQQQRTPSFDWSDPRVTGSAKTWKDISYQPVPDVVPSAEHNTHTNQMLAAPGPVKFPDCVSDSFRNNGKSHARRDGGDKNLSRKWTSRTKKKYKVLSQILESHDESEFKKISLTDNCPLPSVKYGTSCTSYHVHPIAQTFPAMPHRHFMPSPSEAHSYLQPTSASVSLPCQQSCCSGNILRKKPFGVSDQQPHEKELFRPYMNHRETPFNRNPDMTFRMVNTGLENSNLNVVGPPEKTKFQEGRCNDTGGISDGMSYVKIPFHGNPDSQSVSCVNKAGYFKHRDMENIQQFKIPHDTDSQPAAPSWRQVCFNSDGANMLRYPNEINGTWFHGDQRQVSDHNRNIGVVTDHGEIGVEMSHTAKRSRIARTTGKAGLLDNRNEEDGCHGNMVMPCAVRPITGYAEGPSLEQANIVEFVDKSLAHDSGLSNGQSVNQLTNHKNMKCENYCCKCWSRGKCRSCVCSKTGCHNCRNPLCCFKDIGPSCKKATQTNKKVRRQCKNYGRSKRTTKQQNGQEYTGERNPGLVSRTHRQTRNSKQTGTDVGKDRDSKLADSKHSEKGSLMNYTPVMSRTLLEDLREKIGSKGIYRPGHEMERNIGSIGMHVPDHVMMERNNVESRRKSEQDHMMNKNQKERSARNFITEQRAEFTVRKPVEFKPGQLSLLIAVDKDSSSISDKQDESIQGQETFEHSEQQIDINGPFTGQTQFGNIAASARVVLRDKVASLTDGTNNKTSENFIEGTNNSKYRWREKGKKSRRGEKKKDGSDSFVEQNLGKNNNLEDQQRKTTKRTYADSDTKKGKVPKISRSSHDVVQHRVPGNLVDENNNVNTLKVGSIGNGGDGIDINNNDVCWSKSDTTPISPKLQINLTTGISPKPQIDLTTMTSPKPQTDLTTMTSPKPQTDLTTPISPKLQTDLTTLISPKPQIDPVKTEKTSKKSQNQSKRKKSKNMKEVDEKIENILIEEQCVSESVENVTKIVSPVEIKQDGHILSKKGRPRRKPQQKERITPKISIKLEEHTDKYEVTQFTSFHKKDRNIEVGLKSFERFTCRLCCGMYQYNTPDRGSMEDHLAQHLTGRLTCADCGQTFSQAIHVQEHRQKTHRTANFTCELCAKQFFTNTTLKRHLCKAHGHKLFNCKQCPERYSSVDEVKTHVYHVHGGEATKCEKCGAISLSSKAAATHAKSKLCLGRDESNIPCPHCNRILSVSQMAHHVKRIHLRVHTYKCDQCPYTTLARTALNNHMMMHQGVHPFRCELCPFSCVKSYQLSSHMRTHTGVKPYRCDQCSYAAAWNVQLKDHMRAHVSPHSILCEECGILFRDGRCLNLHNKKVHKSEQEVKVTKHRKVKDKGTRQRRMKTMGADEDGPPSNPDYTQIESGCSVTV